MPYADDLAAVLEFFDGLLASGRSTLSEASKEVPAIVLAYAKKAGMTTAEALRRYVKAGEIVREQYPKVEPESDQWYRLKVGVFQGMMRFRPDAPQTPKPPMAGARSTDSATAKSGSPKANESTMDQTQLAVLEALKKAGRPLTAVEARDALNLTETAPVLRALGTLSVDGVLSYDPKARTYAVSRDSLSRDGQALVEGKGAKCAECGEMWPCSDSKRKDISGRERAKHYADDADDVEEGVETAEKMGIQNPNSSGQGKHPDATKNPFDETLTKAGFTYSHSTPVGRSGGDFTLHHTYCKGSHAISVFKTNPNDTWMWQGGKTGAGRKTSGTDKAKLAAYAKGASKRAVVESYGDTKRLKIDGVDWTLTYDEDEDVVDLVRDDGEEEEGFTLRLKGAGVLVYDANDKRLRSHGVPKRVLDVAYDMLDAEDSEEVEEGKSSQRSGSREADGEVHQVAGGGRRSRGRRWR